MKGGELAKIKQLRLQRMQTMTADEEMATRLKEQCTPQAAKSSRFMEIGKEPAKIFVGLSNGVIKENDSKNSDKEEGEPRQGDGG